MNQVMPDAREAVRDIPTEHAWRSAGSACAGFRKTAFALFEKGIVDAGPSDDAMARHLEEHRIPTFRTADRALRLFQLFCSERLRTAASRQTSHENQNCGRKASHPANDHVSSPRRDGLEVPMKAKVISCSLVALLATVLFAAVDISGKWHAEFDTQIGRMTYTYTFQMSGEKITGTAEADMMGGKQQTELKNIKLAGDELTFTEPLTIEGNAITITYKGKVSGNEIKFTRQVGEFATEELVAKRMP
jgi:hypothetical protein